MSKASKHAHTQPFLRASERAELSSHYGAQSQRLSRDSQRAWNACALTLAPPRGEAVVSPSGVLFDREALLENFAAQRARARAMREERKAWRKRREEEKKREEEERKREEQRLFEEEKGGAGGVTGKKREREAEGYFRAAKEGVAAGEPPKPPKGTRCPATGAPLELKELATVVMSERCSACQGVFSGSARVAALVPSGLLVCVECLEAEERPRDPRTGEECSAIRLKQGGTGFAANKDETLVATKSREGFQVG